MLRHPVELIVLLVSLGGCTGTSRPTSTNAPEASVATPQQPVAVPDRLAEELDILESVYRYQFEHNNTGRGASSFDHLFLARGATTRDRSDPSAELLTRFVGHSPPVEPVSASSPDVWMGVKHREKPGRGILFHLADVRWIDDHKVEVDGGYYRASRASSGNTYQVERQDGRWVVVKDVLHWAS